jgi:drug/metabolite transporter (DMT)-like permease
MTGGNPRVGPERATLVAFAAVAVLGGLNAVAVKQMVLETPPLWSAALRFILAGVLLVAIAVTMRRPFPRRASLLGAMAYGAFGFSASYGLLYTALREIPTGTAMVLVAMTPLFTFGLAIAQKQEKFHRNGLAGAFAALAGIAIVFADQLNAAVPLVPLLLVVLATLAIAESGVIAKWTPKSDPFWTNAVAMLTGATLLVALSFASGESPTLPASPAGFAALSYLVLVGSVALFTLYLFGITHWTASAMSYTTLLMPLVTVALAAALFHEVISPLFLIGGAVILAGVYVGSFARRHGRPSTAVAAPECLPVADCPEVAPARA